MQRKPVKKKFEVHVRVRFKADKHARAKQAAAAVNMSFNRYVESVVDDASRVILDKKHARPTPGQIAADAVLSNSN